MHFGATLRLLRVDAGFTLRDLAERIGVSSAYLSRVEHGHDAPPTPDRLAAIARALGLAPTTIVELADRVGPVAAEYCEHVPAARDLMLEIMRRKLGPAQIMRVQGFIAREFPERSAPGARAASAMLDPSRVVLGLACSHLEDAIDVAATRLAVKRAGLGAREIAEAITRREALGATVLGCGLAVPHATMPGSEARAVVLTLRRPLDVDTPDGKPLSVLIVHVHPGAATHTAVLAQLASLADPAVVAAVASSRGPQAAVRSLREALA